jgi:hypothetical protein
MKVKKVLSIAGKLSEFLASFELLKKLPQPANGSTRLVHTSQYVKDGKTFTTIEVSYTDAKSNLVFKYNTIVTEIEDDMFVSAAYYEGSDADIGYGDIGGFHKNFGFLKFIGNE